MSVSLEQDKLLVIVGTSGHARVVADVAMQCGFEIFGFVDDFADLGGSFLDKPVLGHRDALYAVRERGLRLAFVAIGDTNARRDIARVLTDAGMQSPTLVHPSSVVAMSSKIGAGSIVAAGAIVNPNARIGEFCIVNSRAVVEHDCIVGDFAHICPGAVLAGHVNVEEGAWIGAGSTVIEKINVGQSAVVGAGAVVTKDVLPESVVVGVPARRVHT